MPSRGRQSARRKDNGEPEHLGQPPYPRTRREAARRVTGRVRKEVTTTASRRGKLFVVSGPSGVGKGSVVRRLLEIIPDLYLSVSTTTREPRPGEIDERDYEFVDETGFDRYVEDGDFLEWADVYGHRYGTRAKPVKDALHKGFNVILEIDTQGAQTVRASVPDAITIFLVPPSKDELARRLRERGTEDEGDLELRLADAEREMSRAGEFEHVVENDDLQRASAEVAAIIEGYGR